MSIRELLVRFNTYLFIIGISRVAKYLKFSKISYQCDRNQWYYRLKTRCCDKKQSVVGEVYVESYCHTLSTGSFFLPRDQQRVPPARQTNYEGLAYLGEYPLAWAACCANEGVYNLLCDSGADPDAQDSFGNMILHMVVVCDKLVSFDCLLICKRGYFALFLIFDGCFPQRQPTNR